MKYVTSIERLSRQEGREEGLKEMLLSQFEDRFGPLEPAARKVIEKASPEQLMRWAKRILSASSLDEVFAT